MIPAEEQHLECNIGGGLVSESRRCLGQEVLDLNPWAWSGDHSMARDLVPGTLMSSRKVAVTDPSILDLPVTLLELFGIGKPAQMVGRSIFV